VAILALTTHIPGNRHVVGWIRKSDVGSVVTHQ